MKEIEWDYNYFGKPNKDWNQTIVTLFNSVSDDESEHTLNVPIKFKELIESLVYYLPNENRIGRYLVNYVTEDLDYIELNGNKIKIKNYGST